MSLSDTQFDIQSDFCRELISKLRLLVKGNCAFDLDDVEIHQIEFLLKAYIALHDAELAEVFPGHSEAKQWLDRFAAESAEFIKNREDQIACNKMRLRIIDLMTHFHQLCHDYQ
jgi:hypothetical protein